MKILEYKMVKVIEEPLPVCPYCMAQNYEPENLKDIKCDSCNLEFRWESKEVTLYDTWTKEPSK